MENPVVLTKKPVAPETVVEIRLMGQPAATQDAAKRLAEAGVIRINGSVANRSGSDVRVYGVLLV